MFRLITEFNWMRLDELIVIFVHFTTFITGQLCPFYHFYYWTIWSILLLLLLDNFVCFITFRILLNLATGDSYRRWFSLHNGNKIIIPAKVNSCNLIKKFLTFLFTMWYKNYINGTGRYPFVSKNAVKFYVISLHNHFT